MIYSVYEKFIEFTENYKVWDYLTYIVFMVFVLICGVVAASYASASDTSASDTGEYSINSQGQLSYKLTKAMHQGNILLPPIKISCPTNDNITIAFKVKVQNYSANQVLDISVLDKTRKESKHQYVRLPKNGEYIINFSQGLGDLSLDSVLGLVTKKYPYQTKRIINMHGEFNSGMEMLFYDLNSSSEDHGECKLDWIVTAK